MPDVVPNVVLAATRLSKQGLSKGQTDWRIPSNARSNWTVAGALSGWRPSTCRAFTQGRAFTLGGVFPLGCAFPPGRAIARN